MRIVRFAAFAALFLCNSCLLLVRDDSGTALSGVWGGQHVAIDFRTATPSVEYDCARGSIDGPGPAIGGGMVFINSGYPTAGGMPGNVLLAFSVDGR